MLAKMLRSILVRSRSLTDKKRQVQIETNGSKPPVSTDKLTLESGLFQHFHGVQGSSVGWRDFANEKHFAERSLAENFEKLEMRRRRLLASFLGEILYLYLGLVLAL